MIEQTILIRKGKKQRKKEKLDLPRFSSKWEERVALPRFSSEPSLQSLVPSQVQTFGMQSSLFLQLKNRFGSQPRKSDGGVEKVLTIPHKSEKKIRINLITDNVINWFMWSHQQSPR
jgi:hypothetical protein